MMFFLFAHSGAGRSSSMALDTPSHLMENPQKLRLIAVGLSFLIGLTLMCGKFYAYRMTGSSAILSDALESIINVVASAFAAASIWIAAKPPDLSHPYGHGKIEYFSAGFEGALIILAALAIFKTGWNHLFNPRDLPNLEGGLFIVALAGVVNLLLGAGLIHTGKKTHSLTLIADGKHVLTDVYTSGGVLTGLFLVYLTGWLWLDGMVAFLVGINIIFSGVWLVKRSVSGLMDASDETLLRQISEALVQERLESWIDVHQLRAWRSGNLIHLDFHLILPRYFSLELAHSEAKKLEKIIMNRFGGSASVLIHMDPCIDPDCPVCQRHLCDLRQNSVENADHWNPETFVRIKSNAEQE